MGRINELPQALIPVLRYYNDSVPALAEAIRRTPQAVYSWTDAVPRLAAYDIEAATNGRFKASDLNPGCLRHD